MELFSALSRLNFKGVSNPNPEECGYCILEGYPIGYLCIGIHSWQLHTPQPSCSLARDLVRTMAIFCSKHQRQIGIHTVWIFKPSGVLFSSWWFQPPLKNMLIIKLDHFPEVPEKTYENIWNLTTTQFFPSTQRMFTPRASALLLHQVLIICTPETHATRLWACLGFALERLPAADGLQICSHFSTSLTRTLVFQSSIFRCYVSCREGMRTTVVIKLWRYTLL